MLIDSQKFGKVAVLLGGRSAERDISLKSGGAVLDALCKMGVAAYSFDPAEQPVEALLQQQASRAYISLHGRYGEDGTIQGALELMGMPYTGSGVMASALAMDKWRTKLIWQAVGIRTPRSVVLSEKVNPGQIIDELGLPLIIKPAREGSTIGLTKIKHEKDLLSAYQLAKKYDCLVLAEEFVSGKELTVGILGQMPLPVVRIEVAGELYDYQAKYFSNDTQYFCPCGLSSDEEQMVQEQALEAYQILGCEGWGRIDLILDESGIPYFLEANTSPGMTNHSLVPMAAKEAGIGFEELVLRILDLSYVE